MQPRTQPRPRPVDKPPGSRSAPPAPALPLSVIHADALYRPVPPVEYDDEGYPGPDGRMPESMLHTAATHYVFGALRVWFGDRPDALVANDLLMLFEEGNPSAALSPDAMVVFGVGRSDRSSYKVWEEGDAVPAFALEVLSASTWRKDVRVKPGLYAALGVRELVLFEPFGPELAGFALDGGAYALIRELPDGGLPSRALGLEIVVEDGRLRFRDPATGGIIPDVVETDRRWREEAAARRGAEARADAQRARADAERDRADLAERRASELEARLKGSSR